MAWKKKKSWFFISEFVRDAMRARTKIYVKEEKLWIEKEVLAIWMDKIEGSEWKM